ncbi:MAG: hypothetical protein U0746_00930 [Gemmataceae bacterium]
MYRLGLALLALATSLCTIAIAQTSAVPAIPVKAVAGRLTPAGKIEDGDTPAKAASRAKTTAEGKDGKSATDEAKAPEDSPRMKRLKELKYDRRPSSVLKTWSKPVEKRDPRFVGPIKPPEPLDVEAETLQANVTLGNWPAVKAYFASIPPDEGKAGYRAMLTALARGPDQQEQMRSGGNPNMMQWAEKFAFSVDDLMGIVAAAPSDGLEKESPNTLAAILSQGLASGTVLEAVLDRFRAEASKPTDKALFSKRQIAQTLMASGHANEAGEFLPSAEQAKADDDLEALNLLARHYLAVNAKDKKASQLEKAWDVTQAILASRISTPSEKQEALKRAVDLAPRLREELGQRWLDDGFKTQTERGKEILATLGSLASTGLVTNAYNTDYRVKELQLQKTAVESLLKAAPEKAKEWKGPLTMLAVAWLREADFSRQYARSTSLNPGMRRDRYGNIYWMNQDFEDDGNNPYMMNRQQNLPQPVNAGDVLQAQPSEAWLAHVDEDLRPKIAMALAQLYLKVNEETQAFPYIEKLATTHPNKAKDLVNEFLRVWIKNHDPNDQRRMTNPYMFIFGFEQRASGIPLTRSKQERNLIDLAEVIKRLKQLPIGDPDEELLAKAFTSSHSTAEVYKIEAIENVFGPLGTLKPKTLSGLAQKMRENLGGLWRKPAEQKAKGTNRKQKDIEAEVMRGYAVALSVVDGAQKKFPDDWNLQLAKAALIHDENNFRQELAKSTTFGPARVAAMAEFKKAADLYAAKVHEMTEDELSSNVYEQWFYASLGAVDLAQLKEEMQPDVLQPPKVRDAILKLPGELAEKHVAKFANGLFTKMSAVNPACKYTYLKGGFAIVGDHKAAHEAKKVYDYYKDLASEVKLEAVVDGSTDIGHGKPFGVFVNLKHTREIERESGGFGKYLQNQNSGYSFYYNYGRPTADYRDKFQTAATEVLKEQFEILSCTFQPEGVHSQATKEYGWRVTPYCYMLLKAKGPQVDKIAPMRIDLDFLDTSGYVVLPVESAAVPIDCKSATPPVRPAKKITVTQTLDERQAKDGKLILEVKASARGLVPDLENLIDLKPAGFEVAKSEDQGVSVAKYDQETEETSALTERIWLVTFQAQKNLKELPATFVFGKPRVQNVDITYQRYADADLIPVKEPEISLEARYGEVKSAWKWYLSGAGLIGLGLIGAIVALLRKPKAIEKSAFQVPEHVTPFSVIGLLESIEQRNGLSADRTTQLRDDIHRIERHYFADEPGDAPDLKGVAEHWVSIAR